MRENTGDGIKVNPVGGINMDMTPKQFNELISALKSISNILWWIALWLFVSLW